MPEGLHRRRKAAFFLCIFMALPLFADPKDQAMFAQYSDPSRIWGSGIEGVIEEAYRLCFRTRILGGKVMNLRMPFAQDNERDLLTEQQWGFLEGGKGDPVYLWEKINEALDSPDFAEYTQALSDGREKVIIFDIPDQSWTVSRELFDIARMKAGSYRGLPHKPYVLVSGQGLEETDVYNYLYCVGLAGMDCSGFVWHVLTHVAAWKGIDLGQALGPALGVKTGDNPSWYVGTYFFNSKSSQILQVNDEISSLKPADILLFRGKDGEISHSAIIQSIDFKAGIIRYLQDTDEAPPEERGVHESFIKFDPAFPQTSLQDPSLVWSQKRYAPFTGEKPGAFSDDGERFRAYPELGGGKVVRLRILSS
ncbi:MAG: peptidoglycan endopeptidase [Treponema sp.]|nr:peptidoglycan endopeptidase [Treponema sp.]